MFFFLSVKFQYCNNTELDPSNSNSVISNSPLFRTQNHFPLGVAPQSFTIGYFELPLFPTVFRNNGVQLHKVVNFDSCRQFQNCIVHIMNPTNIFVFVELITQCCVIVLFPISQNSSRLSGPDENQGKMICLSLKIIWLVSCIIPQLVFSTNQSVGFSLHMFVLSANQCGF